MNASISIPGNSSKRLSPGCSILPNSLKASGVCEASISMSLFLRLKATPSRNRPTTNKAGEASRCRLVPVPVS